jgi:hypothetical protein
MAADKIARHCVYLYPARTFKYLNDKVSDGCKSFLPSFIQNGEEWKTHSNFSQCSLNNTFISNI